MKIPCAKIDTCDAPVAQLDRVSVSEAEGRPFESGRARQSFTRLGTSPSFLFLHEADGLGQSPVTA
jgi:hypothetical protein